MLRDRAMCFYHRKKGPNKLVVLSILIHTVEYLYINMIFIGNKLEIYVEHDIKKMEQIS